jgi:predicted ATPase
MLSLPNDGRYPALILAAQQRRQKTIEALTGQIEAIAQQSPVLMILEDAHWADPSSLEVFSRLVDKIERLRVLLLVTFRQEFATPWIGRPHVTALTLNRLPPREVMALIEQVGGNKPLPANIRQDIVERADGIPLFVEEMTKAVLEAGDEGGAARTVAAVPSPALAVPASLHASLMARLDRLGAAKAVAQIGAAIGREFSHALLATVAQLPEHDLAASLEHLLQSGLLSRQGSPPLATYLFKHALVQDAAYGTLLREPRRALHARIVETLENQPADGAETRPELLARHCDAAGLIEKAAALWGKAGQQSLARSALIEAEAQFRRALNQIAALPGTPDLRREEINSRIGLANSLIYTRGYSAPETTDALEQARVAIERAEALGEAVDDPLALYSVLYGFWVANHAASNGKASRELAAQLLTLAEKQKATAPLMFAHRAVGCSLIVTGELAEGRAHIDRAIALYDPIQHRRLTTRFGNDVGVVCRIWRSVGLWLIGYPDAAKTEVERALSDAREVGDVGTLLYALTVSNFPQWFLGAYNVTREQAGEIISLAEEKDTPFFKLTGLISLGITFGLTGEPAEAVRLITSSIAPYRATGARILIPHILSQLASAHAHLGQFDDAWRLIDEAMTTAEASWERCFDAETRRIAGDIALSSPERDFARAEAHFERALEIARAQQARSWELRAATSLSRLWRDQGKRAEAHDLLTPVYGWFTEGFDTPDLTEAKTLLAELTP